MNRGYGRASHQQGKIGFYALTAVWAHEDPVVLLLTIEGETLETTPNHPFYTAVGEWVQAGSLQPGDEIRDAAWGTGTVEAITFLATPQVMYNFTVATAHTYFVGDGQWLVHNDCRSLIDADPRLVREAEKLGASHQDSVNALTRQLYNGNLNPGIGTSHVFGNVFEARARDGARVYFRVADDGFVEILGKSTKSNQQRVINILEEIYGP